MSLVDDLRQTVNPILSIRDELGASKQPVSIVTRKWTGTEPGDGSYRDSELPLLPSPSIVDYSADYRVREGGAVQMGDIRLKWISKQSFPVRSEVDGSSSSHSIERFYKVGKDLYRVIHVEEKLLCWNITLRKVSTNQ
jgi:hypothetical protein